MTCDPVGGFVQIPCIERNAIVSTRSLNTALYCMSTDGSHTISFDEVVQTMLETEETFVVHIERPHFEDSLNIMKKRF